MSIIGWIVLGLISGFIASMLVNRRGSGLLFDMVLGVAGALLGGFLFHLVGSIGITGFNIWSMIVAVVGSMVILVVSHAIRRR